MDDMQMSGRDFRVEIEVGAAADSAAVSSWRRLDCSASLVQDIFGCLRAEPMRSSDE
jgi:hypothetical protein